MTRLPFIPLVFALLSFSPVALASGPLADLKLIPDAQRQPAPAFMLENMNGGNSRLSDYKGKLILVNFWATWCMPCRQEMPSMEALWKTYRDKGLVVVGIALDDDAKSRVASFTKIFKLSFPIMLDPDGKASADYQVSGVPASYLIDRNGKLIARIVGSDDWISAEAIKLIESLL